MYVFCSDVGEGRERFRELSGFEPLIKIKDAVIIDASQDDEDKKKEKDMRIQFEAARALAMLTQERKLFSFLTFSMIAALSNL